MIASDPALIERHTAKGWWGSDTLDAHFRRNVSANPKRLAVADPPDRFEFAGSEPRELNYRQLDHLVDEQVQVLMAAGVGTDDIVVFQLPNLHEIAVILLACARIGAIASPVVIQFDVAELRQIFNKLKPSVYLTLSRFKKRKMAEAMRPLCVELGVKLLNIDEPAGVNSGVASNAPLSSPTPSNDVLTICWTSGTEGTPKGVMRSHNLWCATGRMMQAGARLEDGDVILNARPLVNMAAIGGSFYSWLFAAGSLILHHPLNMAMALDQIRRNEVTVTFMPPAFIIALLKDSDLRQRADLTSLRVMGSGSAALPDWAVQQMQERYDVEIVNFFGSNEGVSLQSNAVVVPDTSLRATHFARIGRNDIEWPQFPVGDELETKLVDPESGQEIQEPGIAGELLLRGSTVFSYYFDAPQQTAAAFDKDGYYRSGDLFEIAGDGQSLCYYKFVGRCREVIIRGGFNIAPAEIDNLLSDHPAISEAAAFGYPDERLGERTGVAVVLKASAQLSLEEIVSYLRQKQIAVYKLPEKLLTLSSLPRNAMQKVLRQALTDMAMDSTAADLPVAVST